MSIFIAYLTIPSSSWEEQFKHEKSILCIAYGRFTDKKSNLKRKKLDSVKQGSNFLGDSFSNRDNVKAPIPFRRER